MKRNVSIIILTYNQLECTKACIESIRQYTNPNCYELIIVDNASTDGTPAWLKEQKNIIYQLNSKNEGFPKGCNIGISLANPENHILLLNNDTIVTTNWLENLQNALESDEKIGAVGAMSNHNDNRQGAPFTYTSVEEMQKLAKQNNIKTNEKELEDKVFLIGFCLLIKNEVMHQIGTLDEGYSPGYIEDNDLSLRILKLGYRLVLCHNVFIHHELGTSFRKDWTKFYRILNKNRKYFYQKWKFSAFAFDEGKNYSMPLITDAKKVLEISSGIGVTALMLRYQLKDVNVVGVEKDANKRKICELLIPTVSKLDDVKEDDFDLILIGDALENVKNPKRYLKKISKKLKSGGKIIGEIQNVASITSLHHFLNDTWYDSKKRLYTISDIWNLFLSEEFYDGKYFGWCKQRTEEENQILEQFQNYPFRNLEITTYAFSFTKK